MKKILFILLAGIIGITANAQTTYLLNKCNNPDSCYFYEDGNAIEVTGWNKNTYKNVYYTVYEDDTKDSVIAYSGKYTGDIRPLISGNDTIEACYDALLNLYIFHEFTKKED